MKPSSLLRKMFVISMVSATCLFANQTKANAEYPEKPIELVVWSAPGAPNDILGRQIAKIAPKYANNVNISVLNKKGGSGAVAMAYMLKKPADGYTLMTCTASMITNMAARQIPYGPENFKLIARTHIDPFVMVVKSDSPFNNLNEFFNYAKEHPGELSVGGFGTASAHFLAFTRLKSRAGDPDVRWVAYDGGAEAVVAGLGGHISAVHTNPGIIQEHVKAGKMKVLGISATSTTFPDYVPYTDQGYDLTTAHWRGVMAHGDLNDELAQKVYEVMEKVVADPEFIEYTVNDGVEFGMMGSPAEFQQWYSNEVVETRELMEKFNMIKK